jgi:Ca2+-binding EF-hand superfamily protein
VELAEFLTKEGAYDLFDATEVTEVMQRFDKDGNGHLSPDEMLELRNVLRKSKWKGNAKSAVSEPFSFAVGVSMSGQHVFF